MNNNAVDITLLLDRTGSMAQIVEHTIEGFNEFLSEQRQIPKNVRFTLVQFDSEDPQEIVCEAVPVEEAIPLDAITYIPRARTPLHDALGILIDRTGDRLSAIAEQERPGTVIFAILTDGLENASRQFTRERVFEMIRVQQEVYRWNFIYLGANQDALRESQRIGILYDPNVKNVSTYAFSSTGVRGAYDDMARSSRLYAEGRRRKPED